MTLMRRRRLWVLVAAVVVAVGIAVGIIVHQVRQSAEPPPLGPHAADVYRLTIYVPPRGEPTPPGHVFHLSTGVIGMTLWGPQDDRLPGNAWLSVRPILGNKIGNSYTVHAGSHFTAYGLNVTVLKVWREPDWTHNALDIRADPVR